KVPLALQAGQDLRARFPRLAAEPQYCQSPNLIVQDVQAGIASKPIHGWLCRSGLAVPLGFLQRLQRFAILTDFKLKRTEQASRGHPESRIVLPVRDL